MDLIAESPLLSARNASRQDATDGHWAAGSSEFKTAEDAANRFYHVGLQTSAHDGPWLPGAKSILLGTAGKEKHSKLSVLSQPRMTLLACATQCCPPRSVLAGMYNFRNHACGHETGSSPSPGAVRSKSPSLSVWIYACMPTKTLVQSPSPLGEVLLGRKVAKQGLRSRGAEDRLVDRKLGKLPLQRCSAPPFGAIIEGREARQLRVNCCVFGAEPSTKTQKAWRR